ncbi:hypothetical protein CERSUDRAFT_37241, partial [Gelatoporia subvermispora B]
MMAHKSQGLSLHYVIADFERCKGTKAPYVMASRATTLDGLFILQPFRVAKISCQPSEERHQESQRLEMIYLHT